MNDLKLSLPNGESSMYKEESVKVPVVITLVVLALISTPLILWVANINREGAKTTDTSRYSALMQSVAGDVRTVDAILRNDANELAAINAARKGSTVTLIVPEIIIADEEKDKSKNTSELRVELEGIYWSPDNPLVGIAGETYRTGDKIQGYEIVRIGKTSVQFQGENGTIVVKDMYENLLKTK